MSATAKIRNVEVPIEFVRDLGSHDQFALDLSFHGGPQHALVALSKDLDVGRHERIAALAETYLAARGERITLPPAAFHHRRVRFPGPPRPEW
jgi:hypothetical protein